MNFQIGLDGGGTKTEGILVDARGSVIARERAPGCNPSIAGAAAAGRIAGECLRALRSRMPGPGAAVSRTLLCMAGSREFWGGFSAKLRGFGHVVAMDDSVPVLELATEGGPGIVLHAGTGSFVAARPGRAPRSRRGGVDPVSRDGVFYAGGLGWRLGDAGSAHDLGRRAVARTLLELQGWMPRSGLGRAVCAETGLADSGSLLKHLYSDPAPNARLAALAPAVLRLLARGDAAAGAVAADSVSELADLAARVARRLFPGTAPGRIRAGVSGPILAHPAVIRILSSKSGLVPAPVRKAPIEGVRLLLART